MIETTAIAKFDESLQERGLDRRGFRVLQETIWAKPSVSGISQDDYDKTVLVAVDYCKARNLDPFKKPVHIVPVWDKAAKKYKLGLWPSINEHRITASRTQGFAGRDETKFGPTIKEKLGEVEIEYPSWAQVTVYRLLEGQRFAFVGPKVYWKETYSTASNNTPKPNSMWGKRPFGQIEKCAEAAALRAAFPEELGGQPTAEEMEGKEVGEAVDGDWSPAPPVVSEEEREALLGDEEEIAVEMEEELPPDDLPPPTGPATKAHKKRIGVLAKDKQLDSFAMVATIKDRYQAEGTADLTGQQAMDLIKHLEGMEPPGEIKF